MLGILKERFLTHFNKNLGSSQRYKGFTLSEVLITLGIIGVVASLTIPTLISKYQKIVYVTQLKKFYSTTQNGMKTYMAKMGCSDLACTGLFEGSYENDMPAWQSRMDSEIPKIFKVAKIFGTSNPLFKDGGGSCTFPQKYLSGGGGSQYCLYGDYTTWEFSTIDGMIVSVYDWDDGNCTGYQAYSTPSPAKPFCTAVRVDINGFKGPNTLGRDNFMFELSNSGILYPDGTSEIANILAMPSAYWVNSKRCGTAGSPDLGTDDVPGEPCAARIIDEGWEMNY